MKEALNKMNSKTVQCEEKISNIGVQINKYEMEREENTRISREMQNAAHTAKMLVELKKSVNNVYRNFEEVLRLQQTVKEKYEKMGSIDKWYCEKCSCANPEIAAPSRNTWNYNRNKVGANKQEDIVILEYSVEEDTLSNHQVANKQDGYKQQIKPVPINTIQGN